jgi:hypothetical protein
MEEVKFAYDSLLEQAGFEPLVPPQTGTIDLRPVSSARRRDRSRGEGPRVRISFPPPPSLSHQ